LRLDVPARRSQRHAEAALSRGSNARRRIRHRTEPPRGFAAPRKGVEVLILDSDVDSESSSEVEMFEIHYSSSESSGDDSSGDDCGGKQQANAVAEEDIGKIWNAINKQRKLQDEICEEIKKLKWGKFQDEQ